MNYLITYRLRNDIADLSASEIGATDPKHRRTRASNATRAISAVVNDLKNAGEISGKADIVILEAKVVA